MFVLKSERKTYSYDNRESALSVLLLAKKNGAKIWLESDTYYFDSEVGDILLIANKELLNENNTANTRQVFKSKSGNKGKVK